MSFRYFPSMPSASATGAPIPVAATASPGTVLHVGSPDPDVLEDVWVYALNNNAANSTLTSEWGSTANTWEQVLAPCAGWYLVAPGFRIAPTLTTITGTLSMVNGSVNVVGSGTDFLVDLNAAGIDYLVIGDDKSVVQIDSVTDETNLVLTEAYAGFTGSGRAFQSSVPTTLAFFCPEGANRIALMALITGAEGS